MPRQLEIRTTILAKKSGGRAREKDANANDLYEDEALQLLQELQQLKSNLQKTDQRIRGTYTKSPPKHKKKKQDSPAKKTSYDVVYPSVGSHGRRDAVVSHCLNPGALEAATADDGRDGGGGLAAGFFSGPWASSRTNFTPAPTVHSAGPSHGAAAAAASFWPSTRSAIPNIATSGTSSATLGDRHQRSRHRDAPFQHDGHVQVTETAIDRRGPSNSSSSSSTAGTGGGSNGGQQQQQPAGTTSTTRFKRIFAKATTTDDDQDNNVQQSGACADDEDDSDKNKRTNGGRRTDSGENTGHAPMALNSTDPSNHPSPQWADGAEVDESFQPQTDGNDGHTLVAEKDPATNALNPADETRGRAVDDDDQDIHHQAVLPEAQELTPAAQDDRNRKKMEKTRHYDRDEIRQFMRKQKKERKEKQAAGQKPSFVCHHTRISPTKRSDLGLPDKPLVPPAAAAAMAATTTTQQQERKQPDPLRKKKLTPVKQPQQDWGPYDKPNFVDILCTSPTTGRQDQQEKKRQRMTAGSCKEKSIQTEPAETSTPLKVDEATQVTARSEIGDDDDSSTNWLHTVPTSSGRAGSSLLPRDPAPPPIASNQTSDKKPVPVTNLLRKIENLEQYIGSLLETPSAFQAAAIPAAQKQKQSTTVVQQPQVSSLPDSARARRPVVNSTTVERPSRQPMPPPPYQSTDASPIELPTRDVGHSLPAGFRPTPPSRSVPDGPRRLSDSTPPPPPPPRHSSAAAAAAARPEPSHQLDVTMSTEYHPLPDHLAAFLHLDNKRLNRPESGAAPSKPEVLKQHKQQLEIYLQQLHKLQELRQQKQQPDWKESKYVPMDEAAAGLASLFPLSSRRAEVVTTTTTATATAGIESRRPPAPPSPPAAAAVPPHRQPPTHPPGRQAEEPQQTYFRDFNEILQMDPNPMTERSNSWKRVASRPDGGGGGGFPLPAPAPYTILSALSDELKATMNRIPRADRSSSSDSDFQSRLSVSDISVPDAVASSTTAAHDAPPPPPPSSSRRRNDEIQPPPKNGLGSRTAHEAGSRISPKYHASAPDESASLVMTKISDLLIPATDTSQQQIPLELDTTYMTLTPQYTSFDVSASLVAPLDSTSILDGPFSGRPAGDKDSAKDRSMFSSKLSPIPRAVSPLALVSDSERSDNAADQERKQSTSSSDRSEHDRSVGEKVVDDSISRIKTPPSARSTKAAEADPRNKPDELLSRLRTEIQRDESLYRSLQHVDRLEDSATKVDASKRFRIQIDPKTKTFFETQTDVLRAIAQDVRTGLGAAVATNSSSASAAAFLQGSQAAMEVDRVQSRSKPKQQLDLYSSDFEEPSIRSSPEVPTEVPTESAPAAAASKSGQRSPRSRPADPGSDSERYGGPDSSSAMSDAALSVLPPKAVDILLQEEAKQQRLLLKLREKAQVEKTLAELELLQMQKRILRAQGEREKAASIKKKQRGLLLKLQEERSRIETLRRQHKKEELRSRGSDHLYDSSSWETDWSAASNSTLGVGGAGDSSGRQVSIDQADDDDDDDDDDNELSSTSTLQPVSEAIQATQEPHHNDEVVDDDAGVNQPRSELEGQESGSALSNLRLRAPLSPRTTPDSIRLRSKFRRRHSSGSDDSINLSQNETASDVSDVESRLLALTDQLQRRQAEAQRLKLEHRRLSKEKLKAQESALIKQIEVYDRCITDLRTQLDTDAEIGANTSAVVAVRPVIRQPRALIRADEAKSPTSARSESEAKTADLPSEPVVKSLEADGNAAGSALELLQKTADLSSGASSISTQISRTEAVDDCPSQLSDHESIRDIGELLPDAGEAVIAASPSVAAVTALLPVAEPADNSEKSLSELSTDPSSVNQAETSDPGRADVFNQTMIIKSDSQVKEELAEDISKSILEQLIEETIDLATLCVLKKRKEDQQQQQQQQASSKTDVLQRVSALLSTGTEAPKGGRSQVNYLTTTFDLLSPDDAHSPEPSRPSGIHGEVASFPSLSGGSALAPPCDVASAEGRDALESKLNELRIENEWIDDDLEATPVQADSVPDENRDKVIQEAEALEREQKRIEQEIQRLSAAGSVLYMREIPNKPPPPYTPPGQALNWQKVRSPSAAAAAEVKQIVPKSKVDVAKYSRRFAQFLLQHLCEPDVQLPDELFAVSHSLGDQTSETNCRAFMTLLADLSRLSLTNLIPRATFIDGWKADAIQSGRPIGSREELLDAVEDAVMVQLNYKPRLVRESQLAKWSQKKRDRVDEILVRELQTEEKLWTDFSSEEMQVKRQTADAILDMLLDETAFICKRIIQTTK